MTDQERTVYWGTVEVPYRPFYAYEEILATFGVVVSSPAEASSRMLLTALNVPVSPPHLGRTVSGTCGRDFPDTASRPGDHVMR